VCGIERALFVCGWCNLVREKKDYPNCFLDGRREKDISQPLAKREEKIPQPAHTNTNFSSFFIPKHLLLLLLGQKRNKTLISHHSFFLSFFFSSKLFCACVAAPKEREREKSAAGESARKYTHTRLYNNNNKRPSCLKEREREYRVRVLRACCRYTRRIITTTTTRGRLKAIFIPSRPQKQGSEKERERERDEELFPRESCYSFRWWWW